MDHLPKFQGPAFEKPTILCYCHPKDYDKQGFTGYPQRKGWTIDKVKGPQRIDGSAHTRKELATFLQAWLFLGVLHEVFQISGKDIDLEKFVAPTTSTADDDRGTAHHELTFTTLHLQDEIEYWQYRVREQGLDERLRCQEKVAKVLNEVRRFFEVFRDRPTNSANQFWRATEVLEVDMIVAMLVLGETLRNAAILSWPMEQEQSPLRGVFHFRVNTAGECLVLPDRMRHASWCPSDTQMMLDNNLDCTAVYLACLLRRATELGTAPLHSNCTPSSCSASQINETTYTTKHTPGCEDGPVSCAHVHIDVNQVVSILRDGGIPVVMIKPSGPHDEHIELKVLRGMSETVSIKEFPTGPLETDAYEASMVLWRPPEEVETQPGAKPTVEETRIVTYVAISHVWAEGLGNAHRNSLPRCQLLRLLKMATETYSQAWQTGKPTIWIDTLCIPVEPQYRQERKLAIQRLSETFQDAKRVLILGAGLSTTPANCSRLEKVTRILCSNWMRRLWTYQEAVITSEESDASEDEKLQFQFMDGSVTLNSLLRGGITNLCHTEKALHAIIAVIPLAESTRAGRFRRLTQAMSHRSTSKQEDEAICLASIMNVDVKSVIRFNSVNERMQAFYSLIPELPSNILFHRGDRLGLQADGLSWAPTSFLSHMSGRSTLMALPVASAVRDYNGIHVKFQGYILSDVQLPENLGDSYILREDDNSQPLIYGMPDTAYNTTIREEYLKHLRESKAFDQLIGRTERPAIIINPWAEYGANPSITVSITREEEEDGVIYCKYVCASSVTRISPSVLVRLKSGSARIRKTSPDQRWCVG